MLLADKLIGHLVPVRFALFAFIGCVGLVRAPRGAVGRPAASRRWNFAAAQTVAVVVAIASNFLMNNFFTYRDQRLTGWRLWRGLVTFYVICSVGAVANVDVGGLCLSSAPGVVACRRRRGAGRIGLELRRLGGLHVETTLTRRRPTDAFPCAGHNDRRASARTAHRSSDG